MNNISGFKRPRAAAVPTVSDILNDPLTELATEYWASGAEVFSLINILILIHNRALTNIYFFIIMS